MSLRRMVGRFVSKRAVRRSRPAVHRIVDDVACSAEARRIQAVHRGWLVMWSTWHQTFTAFSSFTPVPLVLDEPTPHALVNRIRQAELFYSTARVTARHF